MVSQGCGFLFRNQFSRFQNLNPFSGRFFYKNILHSPKVQKALKALKALKTTKKHKKELKAPKSTKGTKNTKMQPTKSIKRK